MTDPEHYALAMGGGPAPASPPVPGVARAAAVPDTDEDAATPPRSVPLGAPGSVTCCGP
ncbi:hypothetical protein ACQEU8_02215 [Streptomyces sp. CA-250714]|uniref:hypothetical protein n=1 Tax=Streptomyces sp. CA-250714 TaxID=3240060 RepID=UPI003D8F95D6